MATMLNVYDRKTRQKTAVLQNAFDIVEVQEINQIYSLTFSLPATDEKVQYCQPRHFVRWGDDGQLYRIKSPKYSESDTSIITYECEHVITTLCDTVMFGSFNFGGSGVTTADVIRSLLKRQTSSGGGSTPVSGSDANWELGTCDFNLQYEYLWEQENILNALYSIPKEFTDPYMWTFDTIKYPWKISLKKINPSANPQYYLRAKSNLLSTGSSADYANICTRIYPLGYGEGVNQLTIADAKVDKNGNPVSTGGTKYGKKYIDAPKAYTDKYGIVEKVLVDRKFENANLLYAYAKSMLAVYQEPSMTRTFNVVDLYPLTNQSWDNAEVGKICRMTQDNTTAYITKTQRRLDQAGDLQIDLSTKATDIAANVADLADRIRIESVYAQGATQIYQHSKDANATPDKGMVVSLYFSSEMRQINKVLLRLKLNKFRAYSNVTSTEEAKSKVTDSYEFTLKTVKSATIKLKTTEYVAKSEITSESGTQTGDTSNSTTEASITGALTSDSVWTSGKEYAFTTGQTVQISTGTGGPVGESGTSRITDTPTPFSGGEGHYHGIYTRFDHSHDLIYNLHIPTLTILLRQFRHNHSITIDASKGFGSHSHKFSLPSHTHKVTIGRHRHDIEMPEHTHDITIPKHSHDFTIPAHSHKIEPGIYESGKPNSFTAYINNVEKATVSKTSYNGDITAWLLNDQNQIPRDTWIDLTIVPNDNAYVVTSIFVQGFVQSRGGGNY